MNQVQIEQLMHPKHIKEDIKQDIQTNLKEYLDKAVSGLCKWLFIKEWETKNARKDYISYLDLHDLVLNIVTTVTMHCQKPMPYVSVMSMCSIPGMDKMDSIKTIGEILATIEPVGLYTITKYQDGTRMIESNIEIDESIANRLNLYCYMPPMIEKPNKLEHNYSSGYKTIKSDNLILGFKENSHDKAISLDVLNTLNKQEYELDMDFINRYNKPFDILNPDELKDSDIDNEIYEQQLLNHQQWLEQFQVLTKHLENKTLYFTHKVDKRGRIYSQGFHFHYQSDSYGKACINLKKKEIVTGEL